MTTYYIDGNPPTSFRIRSDGVPAVNIIVTLFGDPTFMDMNALDCCKDAGPHDAGTDKMNQLLPNLFPNTTGALWTHNWHTNLENNFKTHITNNNIEEEEIVFERNKIEVTKLDQYFFSNESGLGGLRVAFDKTKIFEIDTGAQHVDEGPGTGNPNYSFPKPGDRLIFTKSFFEFLGFPNIISQWECTTTGNGSYMYEITLTDGTIITDPDQIRVSNPDKNTHINNETCTLKECIVLILLKELGDVMQTATYLVFIKLAEYLQRQWGPHVVGATIPVQLTQQQKQEAPSLLPINLDDNFYQCLVSKNINYSAIMLTCDNTVHNRNIKLGIPSCITSSHKEVPYDHATHTGRIYLPITDPVEKLKSLLNMEYKIIENNNTTIMIRLTKANTTKKLIYIRQSFRGIVENNIPNNFNTTEIRSYIDGLTQQAKVAEQKILAFITQNEQLLQTDTQVYEYVKNVILGIPTNPAIVALQGINGFREFMCPPIVTPVPPKPNPADPQASIDRKVMKLSLVSLQIPPGNADHARLLEIIKIELTQVRVDVTTMQGGGKSKQRGGTKEFKKTINLVTKFSASEKFLIFILSDFCRQVTDIISDPMEQLEYIFSMYNICIYMLEYYKNIKFNDLNISLNISDPKYAYARLYRVLNILAKTFSYDKTELDGAIAAAIDPEQSERLTLEKTIDMHLSNDVLAYFYGMFNFIDADDRVLPESDADIWDQCTHKMDALTLFTQRIEGSGIYDPIKKHCIATASIINWLNQSYPNGISQLQDSAFIDPFSRLQYKQNVINHIKREYETSKRQHVTTRSHRGGKYSYLSKQFTTNKNKMHNKKLATKTIKYKYQKQKNQRKHKSIKYKSQKEKNQRKYKSQKYKTRKHKSQKQKNQKKHKSRKHK